MTPNEHQEAKELFGKVLDLEPHRRALMLDETCAGRPHLRHEVESLLVAYQKAGTFIDAPLVADALCSEEVRTTRDETMVGCMLGPYRVEAIIGEGGMGVVYRAHDSKLNRPVAIKFLSDALADPSARRRFQREAQVASSLNHPHILTVHDAGELEGRQYLVTELVDAGTLMEWAHAEPRAWPQIVELLVGVADGLAAAHQAGILHRDIKPANILITKSGYAKLADFGLAKLYEDSTPGATRSRTELPTRAGTVVGTIGYMSPEQALGQALDARSDIFSFGVVLYEALAGRRPFTGASDLDVLHAIVHRPAEPLPIDVPLPLRTVVEKALEKDPSDRFQSMGDMVVDLRRMVRQSGEEPAASAAMHRSKRARHSLAAVAALVVLAVASALFVIAVTLPVVWPARTGKEELTYTQITNFTDSAVSPALSPDGKMLAFIRSDNWFLTRDQIYVKLLPNGEPVQLTHDSRQKYGLAFSPDGSRIVYTVAPWSTYVVSPLGGEPSLLLTNSSGVTWLDERRILFSEVNPPHSVHMGVVTANEDRSEQRAIYFPQDERGMVHLSYASPDRQWVLILEMNPVWQPCRVVPLDGRSAGRQVGPKGKCTSAAWSPDGKWVYFGAEVDGHHHLWRQRFPDGQPEQITSGPTEEDGVAVAADGRSLITSIGMRQSAVWIHDARGDRPLSSQGDVPDPERNGLAGSFPIFSRDGKSLFYVKSESPDAPTELWRTDVASERNEKAFPGISMLEFDVSDDAKEVVYSTKPPGKPSELWVGTLDRRSPPRLISASGENSPHFGPDGRIVFRSFDGTNHYLEQINLDGSGRSRVVPYPIGNLFFISPDRRWITTVATMPDGMGGTYAVPIAGGTPQRICSCTVMWGPDGKFLYLFVQKPSLADPGKTLVIPLQPGEMLPKLPALGMPRSYDPKLLPGSYLTEPYGMSPSSDPSVYAYVKTTMHRNLFRIPLR
jgi:serine/threonine protein kinase